MHPAWLGAPRSAPRFDRPIAETDRALATPVAGALAFPDTSLTAEVIPIGRGYQLLRSPEADAMRRRRIQIVRQGAFRRACDGGYTPADVGLFGRAEQLLAEGPGADPRLTIPLRGDALA